MGGLSHLRIDAMNRLIYKVMKPLAFHRANRPAEGGVAKESSEFDITEIGKIEREIVQRLVAQRNDKLISIVIKNALGTYWNNTKNGKSSTGSGSGDEKLCPIVVMENLDSLTPNLGRTKSENRLISTMRAGGIRKKLKQRCRRLGLMLIEVDPAETSTIDSRTGDFGMRAREISAAKFMSQSWIRKKVEEARGRSEKGTALAEDRLWISIDDRLKNLSKSDLAKTVNVFIPSKGGALFLSGDEKSPRIIHADINAACNIGLRALTTPGWAGRVYKVLVDGNNIPDKKKYANDPSIPTDKPLIEVVQGQKLTRKQEVANKAMRYYLFRILSCEPVDSKSLWLKGRDFFEKARERAVSNQMKRPFPKIPVPLKDP
jgi:IS605 OrfB family transposase